MIKPSAKKYLQLMAVIWKGKKLYEKMFQPTLMNLNLTKSEADILLFLHNNKSFDTPKDIVECRLLSKSLVSKSVNSLLKRGYLSYNIDKSDKRYNHLKIETIAIPAVKELRIIQKRVSKILSPNITKDEIKLLTTVLNKLNKNISDELGKQKKNI